MFFRVLAISGLLILQACSGKDQENNTPAPADKTGNVWEQQLRTIDKAKNVEQDINKALERRAADAGIQ
jgi:outer membrane biogenesis lipoprotein LolB